MHIQNTRALTKTATYVKSMEACTTCITPRGVATTKKTELLRVELLPVKEEIPGTTGIRRSHSRKYSCTWRNLKSLSRKPPRVARSVVITRKVTATLIPLEVLGQVVLGKIVFIVRNLKFKVNLHSPWSDKYYQSFESKNKNFNLNIIDKSTYPENSSLENLEEKLILSAASNKDTDLSH